MVTPEIFLFKFLPLFYLVRLCENIDQFIFLLMHTLVHL